MKQLEEAIKSHEIALAATESRHRVELQELQKNTAAALSVAAATSATTHYCHYGFVRGYAHEGYVTNCVVILTVSVSGCCCQRGYFNNAIFAAAGKCWPGPVSKRGINSGDERKRKSADFRP